MVLVADYRPMLAASGPIKGDEADYAFEPKWDGWRALVFITAGKMTARTRTGRVVTDAVPELQPLADAVGRDVVLDGELVANRGTPSSFYRLGGRMAARRPVAVRHGQRTTPLTFVAFDLLAIDDENLTREPYSERRRCLVDLSLLGASWCTSPAYEGMGAEVFAACTQLGLEGLVAKKLNGRYYCGERKDVWVKAKCSAWLDQHARYRHES